MDELQVAFEGTKISLSNQLAKISRLAFSVASAEGPKLSAKAQRASGAGSTNGTRLSWAAA